MGDEAVYFQGYFLISMPGMEDENFSHSVVCISEHRREGAVGFIVNKPNPDIICRDVFEELGIEYVEEAGLKPVFMGGPVQADKIFVLHSTPFDWEGCFRFPPGLAVSNTMDIIKAIAKGAGPEKYLFILGCAGWGEKQLEFEMLNNFWLSSAIEEDILFDVEPEHRWRESMEKIGINPLLLSGSSGSA